MKMPSMEKINIRRIFDIAKESDLSNIFQTTCIALGTLSLLLIAIRLGPIERKAKLWNQCVNTTNEFLEFIPSLRNVGAEGREAMAVSLCYGSTPQKEESKSPNEQL